jgi:RND family efflux transporter MFP subunit
MSKLGIIVMLAALAYGVWSWNHRRERRAAAALPVAAAAAVAPQPAAAPPSVDDGFLGVVLANETVEVASKVDGRIEAVYVHPGDHVLRGAPIAQLDVRSQREELTIARAGLTEARQRLARRIPLARGQAISHEELASSRIQVIQAQSRVRQLEQTIAEARVVAPFDGVIATRYLDVGAVVGPGRAVARLLGKGDLKVRFAVPEERSGELAAGAPIAVHVDTLAATVGGTVESLSPEVDSAVRMSFGVAHLDVPEALKARLSTGLVVHVRSQPGPRAEVAAADGNHP